MKVEVTYVSADRLAGMAVDRPRRKARFSYTLQRAVRA